jgi:hypothetical protein
MAAAPESPGHPRNISSRCTVCTVRETRFTSSVGWHYGNFRPHGITHRHQATGEPHLGNLIGAIMPALELAKQYDAMYFIADYHAGRCPGSMAGR